MANHLKQEYFLSGLSYESDKKMTGETTQQIHKDFEDVFNGIWCFDGTFSLHLSQIVTLPSACQMHGIGRYIYKLLPFGAAPSGDMFQRKIDEIFKDMPNVFGIADDILVVGYEADGRDHDETVQRVLQRYRQVNLNKDKCHFRCTIRPIL